MTTKNNFFKILLILFITIFVAGCTKTTNMTQSDDKEKSVLEDKNREFVMTGKLNKSGNLYLLTTSDGKVQDLESYLVDFDKYLGKVVTVTGEYSGDTLFVTKLE